jgi:hypothetical protein
VLSEHPAFWVAFSPDGTNVALAAAGEVEDAPIGCRLLRL